MKLDTKYMYELLPAYYRELDAENGEVLQAFISLLAREGSIVEDNIDQLYENWFIETCQEWVVPYIGDLLGVKGVHKIERTAVYSQRAYVANTLAYRRRKGTVSVLEQLALDVSGWRAKAVEMFQLLATTQNLNHIRLHDTATPDLRGMNELDLIHTAFDTLSHTVEVGSISKGQGLFNISNVGIFLWRLISYKMQRSEARLMPADEDIPQGAYTFSPLGLDCQLFNDIEVEDDITQLAEEENVPGLLRRNDDAKRKFLLYLDGQAEPVDADKIAICNLRNWHSPIGGAHIAAVDPVLGRITLADPDSVSELCVSYNYGFSGDIGGGPYDRKDSLAELEQLTVDWHVGVSKKFGAIQSEKIFTTIEEAIDAWNKLESPKTIGLITIMDNKSYPKGINEDWKIELGDGQRLFMVAADWPIKDDPNNPGMKLRRVGEYNAEDIRPHLLGNIEVEGTATEEENGGSLVLNGLLVEGGVTVLNGNLHSCQVTDCTIAPHFGKLTVESQQKTISIKLERTISGPIEVKAIDASLHLAGSIVDKVDEQSIQIDSGELSMRQSTVLGEVSAKMMDASNCIFMKKVEVTRTQQGCIRFSYIPTSSITPRRYRCQPDFEISTQIKELEAQGPWGPIEKEAHILKIRERIQQWLLPIFNTSVYGHHAYAQLSESTPDQIMKGADNGSEMGVFNFLQQAKREANIKIVLEEYLRLGLEAGIIYVT